jgi:hypothetical protein
MDLRRVRPVVAAIMALALVTTMASAFNQPAASRRDADAAKKKFENIATPVDRSRRTTVSEQELNAYLVLEAAPQFLTGVGDPSVSMMGSGRVTGRAVVDLDAVRQANPPGGFLDPRMLLRGHVPVTASGTLRTKEGTGRFELESATVGGVPVPKAILQEIVSYYSKSPDAPSGIRLDDAFMLPAGIQEIQVEPDQAVIVQ